MRKSRPELRLEVSGLGTVDPFSLELIEEPSGGGFLLEEPQHRRRTPLELAGLSLAGASQALIGLSMRWMDRAGKASRDPGDPALLTGEVRMVVRRKEARLLAALLRRHLERLPEPPEWMGSLQESLVQIDEYLRWEE